MTLKDDVNDNAQTYRNWVSRNGETVSQLQESANPVSYWTYILIGQVIIGKFLLSFHS